MSRMGPYAKTQRQPRLDTMGHDNHYAASGELLELRRYV